MRCYTLFFSMIQNLADINQFRSQTEKVIIFFSYVTTKNSFKFGLVALPFRYYETDNSYGTQLDGRTDIVVLTNTYKDLIE